MSNEQSAPPAGVPAIFNSDPTALAATNDAAAVARAVQEVQAALVIAQRFPRDEIKCKARILEACKRKELAEISEYQYPRGGTSVTGPTIDLLLAVANRWGNIRYGWTEVERRDGQSTVRCFAWDLQSNGQAERSFTIRHVRDRSASRGGSVELTDERDIYELLANYAARRVRACLEQVIDQDVVDAAIDQCRLTLKQGSKEPITDRVVKLLNWFVGNHGVTKEMLEARLGNKLEAVSEIQLASLQRIAKALKDGVAKREDFFNAPTAAPEFGSTPTPPTPQAAAIAAQELAAQQKQFQPDPELAAMGLAPETKSTKSETIAPVPATNPPASGTPANGNTFVTAVRNLCKLSKCPEGKLLEFAAGIGLSDGSPVSLEEFAMVNPTGLKKLHDNWSDTMQRIRAEVGLS